MRALSPRRIASSALCVTLLLGVTAPAALAADEGRDRTHAAAPVPGADALLAQTKSFNEVTDLMTPVNELVNAALKADNGQLPAADAARYGNAVKAAIARSAATPAAPAAPTTPTAPTVPTAPAVPTAPSTPTSPTSVPPSLAGSTLRDDAKAPADLKAEALIDLQEAVDALLQAVTSGNPANILALAAAVVKELVETATTILDGIVPSVPGVPIGLSS